MGCETGVYPLCRDGYFVAEVDPNISWAVKPAYYPLCGDGQIVTEVDP